MKQNICLIILKNVFPDSVLVKKLSVFIKVLHSRSSAWTIFYGYITCLDLKKSISGPTPSNDPLNGYCLHQNNYVPRHINNRYN
jgi:hypothetical protein